MTRPHAYWWVLVGACIGAVALTVLTGTPSNLPSVALGSTALFHIERVIAFFAAFLIAFVVLTRAWQGHLPSAISSQGVTYPSDVEQAAEETRLAAASSLPADLDPEAEKPEPEVPHDLMSLRLKLEAKMAYLAKALLRTDGAATYLTIGSLNYDGYLTDDEARAATHVLTLRQEELETLSYAERREFLHNADRVVRNLRASVFFGLVRELLKSNGWSVDEVDVARGPRPDLLATKDARIVRIRPRFATVPGSKILTQAQRRLRTEDKERHAENARVIVVPDRARFPSTPDDDPAILKLAELKEELDLAKDPRSLPQSA
jgi:hypothetical protein